MTREEAGHWLEIELKTWEDECKSKHPIKEALSVAIKALEQEPTTKNDLGVDCVARQDVERYIEGFVNEYTPKEELEFINLELDGLKHIPSVTPQEPKTGHWIKGYTFPDGAYWKCDKCNELIKVKIPMRYCNNCGAKMAETEAHND